MYTISQNIIVSVQLYTRSKLLKCNHNVAQNHNKNYSVNQLIFAAATY